jgi:hypothetical protein
MDVLGRNTKIIIIAIHEKNDKLVEINLDCWILGAETAGVL